MSKDNKALTHTHTYMKRIYIVIAVNTSNNFAEQNQIIIFEVIQIAILSIANDNNFPCQSTFGAFNTQNERKYNKWFTKRS